MAYLALTFAPSGFHATRDGLPTPRATHHTAATTYIRAATPARAARYLRASGGAPLAFEANRGQADRRVAFLARGRGYTLFLTATEAVLTLKAPGTRGASARPIARTAVLRLRVVGSNARARVVGLDKLAGSVSYDIGRDRRAWREGVPTYARVAYRGLYPGVDLVYRGDAGRLEFDWALAPGADPRVIKMDLLGVGHARINARGALAVRVAGGDVELARPTVYQLIDGLRHAVAGHFTLDAQRRIGVALGRYDTRRPLIIDPVLGYATYLGGSNYDQGNGIAVDRAGNAYVTGYTASAKFPTSTGAYSTTAAGGNDVFVTKLSATGALLYSTYLGGSANDQGNGIAVDGVGNAYVTGQTTSADFPIFPFVPTGVGTQASPLGSVFVAELDATGGNIVYSNVVFSSPSSGNAITVDGTGNAYVTGSIEPGQIFRTEKVFALRLPPGGSLAGGYSIFLGGATSSSSGITPQNIGAGIATDGAGNAYVAGYTNTTDFQVTTTAYSTTSNGNDHAFIFKVNASGTGTDQSPPAYSTYLAVCRRERR